MCVGTELKSIFRTLGGMVFTLLASVQPEPPIDVHGVCAIGQTIGVPVASSGEPISDAINLSLTGNPKFQRTIDESGTATHTRGGTNRLCTLARKGGCQGAENAIEVHGMSATTVDEPDVPLPTHINRTSTGFGCVTPILLLAN